jgi:hypothetical protein
MKSLKGTKTEKNLLGAFAGVISGKPIPIVNYTDKAVDGVGKDLRKKPKATIEKIKYQESDDRTRPDQLFDIKEDPGQEKDIIESSK